MKKIRWTYKIECDYCFILRNGKYIVEGYDERFVPEPVIVTFRKIRHVMKIMGIEYRGKITNEILETLNNLITKYEERRNQNGQRDDNEAIQRKR